MTERAERVPIPSSFPRVVFNRLTCKTKNGATKVWFSWMKSDAEHQLLTV